MFILLKVQFYKIGSFISNGTFKCSYFSNYLASLDLVGLTFKIKQNLSSKAHL